VPLGESLAVLAHHQRDVGKPRHREPQRPEEQHLARRGRKQVVPANHLGDPHGRVVDRDGELVGGHAVGPGHHEIPHRRRDVERARTVKSVVEGDRPLRNPEPPGRRPANGPGRALLRGEVAAGARIARPLVGCVGRLRRLGDLGAGAEARIGEPGGAQAVERCRVPPAPLRLAIGAERATHVRPLLPVEAKPAKFVEDAGLEPWTDPGPVQVLDAHDECPGTGPGRKPGQQCRSGIPQMEGAGRARSEPSADWGVVRQRSPG
jgi:hypothetical protein